IRGSVCRPSPQFRSSTRLETGTDANVRRTCSEASLIVLFIGVVTARDLVPRHTLHGTCYTMPIVCPSPGRMEDRRWKMDLYPPSHTQTLQERKIRNKKGHRGDGSPESGIFIESSQLRAAAACGRARWPEPR